MVGEVCTKGVNLKLRRDQFLAGHILLSTSVIMLLQLCYILIFTVTFINGQSTLGLRQGDVCKDQGSKAWKCEFILNCPQIGDFKRNSPTICKFEGIDPIICCPPASQSTGNNSSNNNNNNNTSPVIAKKVTAQEVCRIMVKNICYLNITEGVQTEVPFFAVHGGKPALPREHKHMECKPYTGQQFLSISKTIKRSRRNDDDNASILEWYEKRAGEEPAVVGGKPSIPKSHKYMVLIGFGSVDRKSWDCGGSLLSERWVLSAAHCGTSYSLGPARWARVGDLDISTTNDDARPQEKIIIERIIHPNYKEPAVYNDIALFKLDSEVLINSWVAPICLHTTEEINVPKATVTGWGRIDFAGEVSVKLQEAQVTLVSGTDCRRSYSDTGRKIPNGIDTQSMICAGEKEGGKDACSGDSGGPLVIEVPGNCLKTQIGVTSFGKECGLANSPGVYTKVSHFVPWIESIVWPN